MIGAVAAHYTGGPPPVVDPPFIAAAGAPHTLATNGTAKTVECPPHEAGDHLLLLYAWDGSSTAMTVPDVNGVPWTARVVGGNGWRGGYRELVATSAQATAINLDVTLGTSEMGAAQIVVVRNATPDLSQYTFYSTLSNASMDHPPLNPTWGAADTLWIAYGGWDNGTQQVTAYPDGYASGVSHRAANSAGAGFAYSTRQAHVSTEDPAPTVRNSSGSFVALTIGLRPDTPPPVGVPYFVGTSTAQVAAGGPQTLTAPEGLEVGDVMLLHAYSGGAPGTSAVPATSKAWTVRGTASGTGGNWFHTLTRTATADDLADGLGTITPTANPTNSYVISAMRGVAEAGHDRVASSSSTVVSPVTGPSPSNLVVVTGMVAAQVDLDAYPAGWTRRRWDKHAVAQAHTLFVFTRDDLLGPATSEALTITPSASTTTRTAMWAFPSLT